MVGILSLTSSATAITVSTATVIQCPIQDAQVPSRLIQCSIAAQATTAGAVKARRPATTPISRASNKTSACVMAVLR